MWQRVDTPGKSQGLDYEDARRTFIAAYSDGRKVGDEAQAAFEQWWEHGSIASAGTPRWN